MLPLLLLLQAANSLRPEIDFATLGHLGVGGGFDGLSILPTDYLPNSLQSPSTDSVKILAHFNNTLIKLGTLNLGGSIKATCPLKFGTKNLLYVGGEFSRINEKSLRNVAWIDIATREWLPLGAGVDGPVHALACDSELGIVYVGGNFSAFSGPDPYPRNKISTEPSGIRVWSHDQAKWQELRFGGVDGPVNSIALRPLSGNVVLGGQFSATTDTFETSNPFANFVDLRDSSMKLDRYGTVFSESFANGLICGDNGLVIQNPESSYLDISSSSLLELSGIRLWNPAKLDVGLDQFEIVGLPGNTPLSLSKVIGSRATPCSPCHLLNVTDPQEFIFKQPEVQNLNTIRIKFQSRHGSFVSLKKLELFSYNTVLSPPSGKRIACENSLPQRSGPTIPSGWRISESAQETFYLIPQEKGQVVFEPTVRRSGIYNVNLYLPCPEAGCPETRELNINIANSYDSNAQLLPSTSLRNNYNKRIQSIYRGFISSKKDLGKDVPPLAIAIGFVPGTPIHRLGGLTVEKMATGKDLLGVFEFRPPATDPKDASSYSPVEVNKPEFPFQAQVQVQAVAASEDDLAVGGQLDGRPVAQLWKGPNSVDLISEANSIGVVSGLAFSEERLFVGGEYKFPSGKKRYASHENLALVDLKSRAWEAVYENMTAKSFAGIYSSDRSVLLAGQFDVRGRSPVPARLAYLEYMPKELSSPAFLFGNITAIATIPEQEPWTFFAGPIRAEESLRSTGVGYFSSRNALVPFPAVLPSNATDFLQGARINTGLFSPKGVTLQPSVSNRTTTTMVLGGLFQVGDLSGVAIFQNETWTGLGQPISGEVLALHCADSDLLIGGEFDGPLETRSLVKWSFKQGLFESIPVPLSANGRPRINSLSRIDTESNVIVAGRFAGPSGVAGCRHICLLEADLLTWTGLGSTLPEAVQEVYEAVYFGNSIMAAPNTTAYNDILIYGFESKQWRRAGLQLPGPPHHVKFDNRTRGLFIFGPSGQGSYLNWWDGDAKNLSLGQPLEQSRMITQAIVVPIKASPGAPLPAAPFAPNTALLVSGDLHLDSYGFCSGAIFDGVGWFPYFTSTRISPPGAVPGSAVLFQDAIYYPRKKEYLPVPLIILISLAISLAIVFAIIGIGMLLTFLTHQRQQISRQSLVPLLSDASPVGPSAMAFTSPLGSPLVPQHSSSLHGFRSGNPPDSRT